MKNNTFKTTRGEKAFLAGFGIFWILGALLSLGVSVAIIWGIVKLVSWVVAQ